MIVMTIANRQATRHLKKKFIPFEASTSFVSKTSMLLSANFSARAFFSFVCLSSLIPFEEEKEIFTVLLFDWESSPLVTVASILRVSLTTSLTSFVVSSPS